MQAGLRARMKSWKSNYAKYSITWLLALLIGLFFTGMLLLSHLNLSYSQQAMSELRREQIRDVFFASLTRIDARQAALQRYTSTLAIIGETFHRLSLDANRSSLGNSRGNTRTIGELRAQLETSLSAHLSDFEGASGAGIWFEPGILANPGETYSTYFVKTDQELILKRRNEAGKAGGYRAAPWFERTLGADWTAEKHTPTQLYWSPVYFDFTSERAVLTLAIPVFGKDQELIGMVTTDWASDQIIDLVSHVEVTQNSFSFLNDRNNRNLSSLSRSEDTLLEQKIIDAILAEQLSAEVPVTPLPGAAASVQPDRLQTRVLEVEGRVYEVYYAATPAGMVYGAGVPRDEIDRVLVPMQDTNYRILITTGSVLLLLSMYLLFRIVQLMRELQASYTDALTGLPNRARLLKDLEDRTSVCLMIVDLDRFKEINSLFGNACGDQVLRTLAEQINAFIKACSKVFDARLYRLHGDEFALLGPVIPEAKIREFADNLSNFLRNQRVYWQQQSLSVDTSAGIAYPQIPEHSASPDQLLSQATIALLQAREQKRNYVIYDVRQEVEKDYKQNLYWAQRLKEAMEQDLVVPHFQPIYDNRQKRISKYECLARMLDSDKGVTNASSFLGIANKLRLDRQITCLMIEKSFAVFLHEPYEFSINLSYADLVEPAVLELILKYLGSSDIGSRVILEILESDGIKNYSEVLYFIEQVKPFGCQIAIDDFGTGYSNFAHLLELNVDIIKIDGSLIQYLDVDQTAFYVTKGIVQFARSLGIKTVAEFVHSEAVQVRVIELGIDFSQGEYISMPGPTLVHSDVIANTE